MKRLLLVSVLVLVAATGYAQTPDGETPANEGVCDELIGLTPGLYGLCVAFCEAQDCEATLDPVTGEVTFDPGRNPSNPERRGDGVVEGRVAGCSCEPDVRVGSGASARLSTRLANRRECSGPEFPSNLTRARLRVPWAFGGRARPIVLIMRGVGQPF